MLKKTSYPFQCWGKNTITYDYNPDHDMRCREKESQQVLKTLMMLICIIFIIIKNTNEDTFYNVHRFKNCKDIKLASQVQLT